MAFGDALRGDGATVRLDADTGQFNAKVEAAERQWRESIGQMSRESLKLDLAQDRLRKSLASYGAESAQAKRATIGLRDAEEAAARATDRMGRELRENERHMSRLSRGALAGSGAFRGLGRSLAFASAGFLSGAGFVYAVRQALSASSNLNEQMDFARRTFDQAFPVVENFANNALGLARDQAYEATAGIGALLKPLDVAAGLSANLSVRLSKLAVDFASMRNARLEDVLVAIRAGLVGESEPLRRFAVLLSEARVQQVALAQSGKTNVKELTNQEKVLARVSIIFKDGAQAVGNYGDTIDSVANQEREAQKNWRNTQILIGKTLRPAYQGLLQDLNRYLGDAENQRRIQEKVNEAVEIGGQVIRGFADALRTIRTVGKPVVDMLGGLENAVKLATLVWVAFKIKAVASFAATAAASALTRSKVVADAAVMGAALDAATRPRIVPVTIVGGGGGARGALPILGSNLAIATIIATVSAGGGGTQRGDRSQRYPLVYDAVRRAAEGNASSAELRILREELGQYSLANAPDANIRRAEQRLAGLRTAGGAPDTFDPRRPGAIARPGGGGGQRGARGGGGPGGGGTDRLADLELALARAQTTRDTADDARALRDLRSYYARQIRALEARKSLSAAQKEKLRQLYSDIANVQSQLDAIAEENERRSAEQRERARERRRKEQERRERAEARAQAEFERRTRARDLAAGRRGPGALTTGFGGGLGGALVRDRQRDRTRAARRQAGGAFTQADAERLFADWLARLHGVITEFGWNFQPDGGMGQVATQSTAQTWLLREQNALLRSLSSSVRHPASRYAGTELSAAAWGVGF